MKSNTDLREAEAQGKLKVHNVIPVHKEIEKVDQDQEKVFDNPEEFSLALGRAKLNNIKYLTVSSRLIQYLLQGRDEPSVSYNGIRLYVSGAKKDLDAEEAMSAEARYEYQSKKRINS